MKKYVYILLLFLISFSAISYSQIKLGVMTYSYRHLPYEEMLQQCQRLNIHYIELDGIHANYLQYSPEDAPKLIETAKKYGININVYHAGARNEEGWDKLFRFAEALGVKVVSSAIPYEPLEMGIKYAKKHGIKLALHNHWVPMAGKNKWKTLEYDRDFDKVANQFPDPIFGFNLDNGHFALSGGSPLSILKKYYDRTYHIHFKDYVLLGRRPTGTPFGNGAAETVACLKYLKDKNYPYLIALEYERDDIDIFHEARNYFIQSKKILGTFNPVSPNVGYAPKFVYKEVDSKFQGGRPTCCLVHDLNRDGLKDIIIGSYNEENNLVWYENPTWQRHLMANINLEAGGALIDINNDGRLDIIGGNDYKGDELYWVEAPEDPTQLWKVHLIDKEFKKYHDQAFGDIDGDRKKELIIPTQGGEKVMVYYIPKDPTVEPWPKSCRNIIADEVADLEGIAAVDINRDGVTDIVCGGYWFIKAKGEPNRWITQQFSQLKKTKLAVGDINNDSYPDIILAEGEIDSGKLVWHAGPEYDREYFIDENLFHPHSLVIEDFDHDDHLDIIVGEMGLKEYGPKARIIFYHNKGNGEGFEKTIVSKGIPTHNTVCTDIDNDGDIDIICKSFAERTVGILYNQDR